MLIIALDTSTSLTSIALYEDGLRAERTWLSAAQQTRELLPMVRTLLLQERLVAGNLDGVVVALGPGSFSGVRVGVSCAKALALAVGIPVVGVGTLEYTAYQHARIWPGPIRPVLPAGRGVVNTALYRWNGSELEEIEPPVGLSLDQLLEMVTAEELICGELQAAWAERLGKALVSPPLVSPAARTRRSAYLAELGAKRLAQGRHDELASLQPIYLRPAVSRLYGSGQAGRSA